MSGRPIEISSRDVLGALTGSAIGFITLIVVSEYGLNRPLAMMAVLLGLATIWSGLQWHETVTGLANDGRPVEHQRRLPPPATGRRSTAEDHRPITTAPGANRFPTSTHFEPVPMDPAHHPTAAQEQSATPAAASRSSAWVVIDHLQNDLRFRELQCGACASYDVVPEQGPARNRSLVCARCYERTGLDPTGRPHAVRVQSNPERSAERSRQSNSQIATATNDEPTRRGIR